MKAKSPIDGKFYYFINKCMPFGASISCAHFQAFSNAVSHIMKFKTKRNNVNYLDDFLFVALWRWICNGQVETFLQLCKEIKFPVSMEKTVWASNLITFLGMLIDTVRQIVMIPIEKVSKALTQIDNILSNKRRKTTVLKVQKLCGLLNFICRAVVPGRPFLMHLYQTLSGIEQRNLKPHHHVTLSRDSCLDLQTWKLFLQSDSVYCRPFLDYSTVMQAEELDWATDAAKSVKKGYGGHFKSHWFMGKWDNDFLRDKDPSIEFLELYALTISVLLWTSEIKNKRIVILCDNQSVVYMVNNQSSKCPNCMTLVRIITLQSLIHNVRIYARHLRTHENGRADALSRDDLEKFVRLSSEKLINIDSHRTAIPYILENISSWWIN